MIDSDKSIGEVKYLIKEVWSFFNILCILEGGNDNFTQFMKSKGTASNVQNQNDFIDMSDNSALLEAYRLYLRERVSSTFGYLGTHSSKF